MLQPQLIKYSEYNLWANWKISGYVLKAGDDVGDVVQPVSFPTIRKTLYHIWDAELIWYSRLNSLPAPKWPPSAEFAGNLVDAVAKILESSEKMTGFTSACSEEKLDTMISYTTSANKPYSSKISDVLMHCFNHSTYHRGQIINMMRTAGFTDVGSTDYISYCRMQ